MKPDANVLRCLCHLQEPGFEPLLTWLQGERQRVMEVLVNTNDDQRTLHQWQGRARMLGDLLQVIDTARDTLTKLEGKR